VTPAPAPGHALAVHVRTGGGVDAELAADALWQAGAVAVEERAVPGGVLLVAASADGGDPGPLLAAVAGRWPAEVVPVDLGAALDAWRPHARAVTAGRVTVRPPWAPPPPPAPSGAAAGTVGLVVDPGRAFGSGSHASTRLALALLGDLVRGGERVVDVGCGSGVLAVAALALGAASAVATDVDPAALAATADNAERNGVADRLRVVPAVADIAPGEADLVVANILAPVLVDLAPALAALLAPGGTLVLSGFLAARRPGVVAAFPGLAGADAASEEGWSAVALRRDPDEP
jgi:ribosomal protein L11 methyltransferase